MGRFVSAHGDFADNGDYVFKESRTPCWEAWLLGDHPHRALFRALGIVLLGALVVQSTVLPLRVDGNSMEPSFESRELLLADRLSYWFRPPQVSDVVAIKTNQNGITILKRIIAGPGDIVTMTDGRLNVNGEWLIEPYAASHDGWSMPPVSLGTDEYWVVGDNRSVSVFGKVHRGNILGKVW